MLQFNAVENSSIWDVCLNTYGTLNYLVKLMVDNNHAGVNIYPNSGQIYLYEQELVENLDNQIKDIKYATG